jgi:hypothetical protein
VPGDDHRRDATEMPPLESTATTPPAALDAVAVFAPRPPALLLLRLPAMPIVREYMCVLE